jgi:AcrR family transcriptional regulator
MTRRPAQKRYHHGDLRNALIKAGTRLLRDHGVAGLTLRAVAKRAGVSHTAPYRHFRDKVSLLAAIATVGFEQLSAAMAEVVERCSDDPAKQLIEAGIAYVLLAVRNPETAHLMFGGGSLDLKAADETLEQAGKRAFEGLVQIVENGLRAGIYRDGDAGNLALAAWANVHGLASLIIAGRLKDAASSEQQVIELTRYVCQTQQSGMLRRAE